MGIRLVDRLRPWIRKLEPAAKVVEAATDVLGALEKPTFFGVANAIAGGARSLSEVLTGEDPNRWMYETCVPPGTMAEGLRRAGATVLEVREGKESRTRCFTEHGVVELGTGGELWFASDPRGAMLTFCAQAADRVLPPVVRVVAHEKHDVGIAVEEQLTTIETPQAAEIWGRTRVLLDGGRVILLNGRPGVGKTTIAQAIARDAGLGRVVVMSSSIVGYRAKYGTHNHHPPGIEALRLLSAGVIVVDDVDKINLDLEVVERLRDAARLVIFTANNGQHDRVLDAALMRPARIDEVFTIKSTEPIRRPPFDKLDDVMWKKICDWPCAYVNEVEKRLLAGVDLRIEDLEERLKLRTRSGEDLL